MPVLRHRVPAAAGREGARALSRAIDPAAPRSVVVAPQWIGDAVMSEPLVAALAARGERIAVAALPWVAPVYRAMPAVDEVIELPFAHGRLDLGARWRIARSWHGRFDRAYVLPNSLKSALLPFLAGIPRRIGYRGEGRVWLLDQRLPNPPGRPPMVAFYLALAGPGAGDAPHPVLRFDPPRMAAAARAADVEPGDYAVFAPGAEYGPAKIWPPSHYAELARRIHAREHIPVLLLGSGKEADLCEAIAAEAPGVCRVLAGKTSLLDAMALIAGAREVATNDSGLMHVAAAFGRPQVAVFGSTSPEHTPPLNERARVIWLKDTLDLDCMPCFERTCRYGHYRCLTAVTPELADVALQSAVRGDQLPSLPT